MSFQIVDNHVEEVKDSPTTLRRMAPTEVGTEIRALQEKLDNFDRDHEIRRKQLEDRIRALTDAQTELSSKLTLEGGTIDAR